MPRWIYLYINTFYSSSFLHTLNCWSRLFFQKYETLLHKCKFTFNIHKIKRIKILYNSSIYDDVMKKQIKQKLVSLMLLLMNYVI